MHLSDLVTVDDDGVSFIRYTFLRMYSRIYIYIRIGAGEQDNRGRPQNIQGMVLMMMVFYLYDGDGSSYFMYYLPVFFCVLWKLIFQIIKFKYIYVENLCLENRLFDLLHY